MKHKIQNFLAAFSAAVLMITQTAFYAYSEGDPNIEGGGGGMGQGTSQNYWSPGDDGVRVTVVSSQTGLKCSVPIDYTNRNVSDIRFHFGKTSKAEYVGGAPLRLNTGSYSCRNPSEPLPTIVSDGENWNSNIDQIRSYFTDEQVINGIAADLNFKPEDLIGGEYMLMLEPLIYITYNGNRYAMTATEAALYNQQTGGGIKRYFADLSHKNLPLAMFLEHDDLGYRAWTGSVSSRMTDSDIINYLGIGLVSFKERESEIKLEACDYEYRVDTDVYTSVTVSGGMHTPDNPVSVIFTVKNKRYSVNNIVFPSGDSQLVWFKWHTPKTEQSVVIDVMVIGGASVSEAAITADIVDLDKNPPPDPTAYDKNDGFKKAEAPYNEQRTANSWSVWSAYWLENWVWVSNWVWKGQTNADGTVTGYWVDEGYWEDQGEWIFTSSSYNVSMSAVLKAEPDKKNPTSSGKIMKSGYGINETVSAKISGNGAHTGLQTAVAYFPEFGYEKYRRILETTGQNTLEFKRNEHSTYNRRTHFTPLWYPDGSYGAYVWALDCWTPAGMLSVNLTDSLTIRGNVYDDWHIAPRNPG